MTFETGHPWITFKDPCNVRNPQDHAGVIHNSNLCTEITLNNSDDETAVCNLGSINLVKMIADQKIDGEKLRSTVHTAMQAKNANMRHRPVGLGLMGYQDALYEMDIRFDSESHLDFADEVMEKISYYAIECSALIAAEKGRYESYAGSNGSGVFFPTRTVNWYQSADEDDWSKLKALVKKNGMRNSNCLAIAPTATISNIVGVQPRFICVINNYLANDLRRLALWEQGLINKIKTADGSVQNIHEIPAAIREKYKIFFEIEPEWVLKAAARRGKWIDQSQSVNICLQSSSGKILNNTYMTAWELGLKTTYYLRTLSASQVTKTVKTEDEQPQIIVKAKQAVNAPATAAACSIDDPTCEACQ
ncbi:hypothetical protein CHS0354_030045 [Potamilus streckersoni]|uniref:Ribonucleotide reductase large subunit domain-containing protein n=1 Tax=Potamilus streckersoni TaxID=2493646 RepID=A0AAE0VDC7_9BIVA|nr:hypothetical protein CHS0354_030045 [Potamilus streckersoni]